jgi:hypothetical protein
MPSLAGLDYDERGAGEVVCLVHAGVFSAWFGLLFEQPALDGFRVVGRSGRAMAAAPGRPSRPASPPTPAAAVSCCAGSASPGPTGSGTPPAAVSGSSWRSTTPTWSPA